MYPDTLRLSQELREAHASSWQSIARAGDFWRGAERVAMVAEARNALRCPLCRERKAALSPGAVTGTHSTDSALDPTVVDMIHRLRTDPGRLTHSWFESVIASGISPAAYVEIVSVVNSSVIVDTLHLSLGLDVPELPEPIAGEPSGEFNPDAVDGGAWVPITAAAQDVSDTGLPSVPNILRAMGLVPGAVALFFNTFRPHYSLKDIKLSISQAQAEFVASRVSALNECFY